MEPGLTIHTSLRFIILNEAKKEERKKQNQQYDMPNQWAVAKIFTDFRYRSYTFALFFFEFKYVNKNLVVLTDGAKKLIKINFKVRNGCFCVDVWEICFKYPTHFEATNQFLPISHCDSISSRERKNLQAFYFAKHFKSLLPVLFKRFFVVDFMLVAFWRKQWLKMNSVNFCSNVNFEFGVYLMKSSRRTN